MFLSLIFLLLFLSANGIPYDNVTISERIINEILSRNPFSEERTYKKLNSSVASRIPRQYVPAINIESENFRIMGVLKIEDKPYIAVMKDKKIILIKEGEKLNGAIVRRITLKKIILEYPSKGLRKEIKLFNSKGN